MSEHDLRDRFFRKITADPRSDCILWTAAKNPAGYGLISVGGKLRPATHVSWFLKHGIWPGQKMLHRCDNPTCVNPEHLFEGSDADNAADRDAKGRHRALSGDDAPWTKLTGLEVSEIVALTETRMTNDEIGALFGVGGVYVSSLRHGRWRTKPAGRGRKPKGCRRYGVGGGEMLTVAEIAVRSGVSQSTVDARIKRGVVGAALLAGRHAGPRKPYIRRN